MEKAWTEFFSIKSIILRNLTTIIILVEKKMRIEGFRNNNKKIETTKMSYQIAIRPFHFVLIFVLIIVLCFCKLC